MSGHLMKTDSEVSSLTPSSPTRSSPARGARPAYFVQSPSRDSHDATTTNSSHHSTPVALSPNRSLPRSHSNSSLGPHSHRSSSTRFSGSLKHTKHGRRGSRRGGPWKDQDQFNVIEEEGLLDGDGRDGGLIPRRCYFPAFVAGFFMLFSFFALILWGASRPQKPRITMKTIKFDEFVVQAGMDHSGVTTSMVSMNSTVKLMYRNTGTFFGVHVASSPLDLFYSQLTLATGNMNKFYQSRKSQRSVTVTLKGSNIPVYGGGADLGSVNGAPIQPVPLTLTFLVRSRAYILGRLVRPSFRKRIVCSVVMDPKKMARPLPLVNKCTYM